MSERPTTDTTLGPLRPGRLLGTKLDARLLGIDLTAGFYLKNPFRLVGMSARADRHALESAVQRFRNLWRLDPRGPLAMATKVGYEDRVDMPELDEWLNRLNDPRYRIVSEVFWPQLPDDVFRTTFGDGSLITPDAATQLRRRRDECAGIDALLATHALAVAGHNRAIAAELQFVEGRQDVDPEEAWQLALRLWDDVLGGAAFWDHVEHRIRELDDPRVKVEDLADMKDQLPQAVLGINGVFANAYAEAEVDTRCTVHLTLINDTHLPGKSAVSESTLHRLVELKTRPLVERIEADVLPGTARRARKDVGPVLVEVLAGAQELCGLLTARVGFSSDQLDQAEFDTLCRMILEVTEERLDYDSDDRGRTFLFSLLVTKRMLRLPISPPLQRKLAKSFRKDIEYLYGEVLPDGAGADLDPTSCWFIPGETADPDASLEIDVYKITDVNAARARWTIRKILIPRSKRAEAFHKKKFDLTKLAESSLDPEAWRWVQRIHQVEARMRTRELESLRQRDQKLASVRTGRDAALARHDEATKDDVAALEKELEQLEEQRKKEREKILAEKKQAISRVEGSVQGQRDAAQERYEATARRWQGFSRAAFLELPLAAGLALASLAVGSVIDVPALFQKVEAPPPVEVVAEAPTASIGPEAPSVEETPPVAMLPEEAVLDTILPTTGVPAPESSVVSDTPTPAPDPMEAFDLSTRSGLLSAGTRAYEVGQYDRAAQLLAAGVDPNAGTPESTLNAGLDRLTRALLEDRQNSLAQLWMRWRLRAVPDLPRSSGIPIALYDAAREFTARSAEGDRFATTSWEWPDDVPDINGLGVLRIEPVDVSVPVQLAVNGVVSVNPGRPVRLRPGSYRVTASAQGYETIEVTREVLPGVTTEIRLAMRPETPVVAARPTPRPPVAAARDTSPPRPQPEQRPRPVPTVTPPTRDSVVEEDRPAILQVSVSPWAIVTIDGVRLGRRAQFVDTLTAGVPHLLRFEREGAVRDTVIELTPGEIRRLNIRFSSRDRE